MGEAGHCWLGGHFPLPEFAPLVPMPSLCCFLQKLLHFLLVRDVASSFAEVQPRRQNPPPTKKTPKKTLALYVLRLRFLWAQRLQKYLSNITVCWRFSVTSRKRNDKFSSGYPLLAECVVEVLATDQCCEKVSVFIHLYQPLALFPCQPS